MSDPNWAEQVTAISTAIGSIGLLSTLGLAIFAGLQVREAQHARHAQLAADFLRRWDEDALVETRRLVAQYATGEELAHAFAGFLATNSVSAYVLLRELDFFEQLGALEAVGAFDFELIEVLLGTGSSSGTTSGGRRSPPWARACIHVSVSSPRRCAAPVGGRSDATRARRPSPDRPGARRSDDMV